VAKADISGMGEIIKQSQKMTQSSTEPYKITIFRRLDQF
jgi:hypothetical protein